uniref:Uncharacterized protein n=1 Tax=Timema monikensis TaxID=170555 RepID=A0A7R9HSS4_9NEOP|nr:unnamed protein product [Timema monikensis]
MSANLLNIKGITLSGIVKRVGKLTGSAPHTRNVRMTPLLSLCRSQGQGQTDRQTSRRHWGVSPCHPLLNPGLGTRQFPGIDRPTGKPQEVNRDIDQSEASKESEQGLINPGLQENLKEFSETSESGDNQKKLSGSSSKVDDGLFICLRLRIAMGSGGGSYGAGNSSQFILTPLTLVHTTGKLSSSSQEHPLRSSRHSVLLDSSSQGLCLLLPTEEKTTSTNTAISSQEEVFMTLADIEEEKNMFKVLTPAAPAAYAVTTSDDDLMALANEEDEHGIAKLCQLTSVQSSNTFENVIESTSAAASSQNAVIISTHKEDGLGSIRLSKKNNSKINVKVDVEENTSSHDEIFDDSDNDPDWDTFSTPPPISAKKKADLLSLCKDLAIPAEFHRFYSELPATATTKTLTRECNSEEIPEDCREDIAHLCTRLFSCLVADVTSTCFLHSHCFKLTIVPAQVASDKFPRFTLVSYYPFGLSGYVASETRLEPALTARFQSLCCQLDGPSVAIILCAVSGCQLDGPSVAIILLKCVFICLEGEWKIVVEKTLSPPNRDSNLNLLVIGILVYWVSSASYHAAIKLPSIGGCAPQPSPCTALKYWLATALPFTASIPLCGSYCSKDPRELTYCSKDLRKLTHYSKDPRKLTYCSKDPRKLTYCSKDPRKLTHCSKDPRKLTYCSKDPRKLTHCSKDPRKLTHYSKDPRKLTHCSKDPRKLTYCSKDPRKLTHCSKDPRKLTYYSKDPRKLTHCSKDPRELTYCSKDPRKLTHCNKS